MPEKLQPALETASLLLQDPIALDRRAEGLPVELVVSLEVRSEQTGDSGLAMRSESYLRMDPGYRLRTEPCKAVPSEKDVTPFLMPRITRPADLSLCSPI